MLRAFIISFVFVSSIGVFAGNAKTTVPLVVGSTVADIYVASNDFPVVKIAARLLADDIERVTGKRPEIKHDVKKLGKTVVLIGTLGKSSLLGRVAESGNMDLSEVSGKWETYAIHAVEKPCKGVENALVIVGADRRGAAYGVMDICRHDIGVSPWYWWADIPVRKRENLSVTVDTLRRGSPSVQYRGIFINDEAFGLLPWARKTFDPQQSNGLGPKTYEKVYEVMLRLKLNYIWPSMWNHGGYNRAEFMRIPGNVELADKWAIVMGVFTLRAYAAK